MRISCPSHLRKGTKAARILRFLIPLDWSAMRLVRFGKPTSKEVFVECLGQNHSELNFIFEGSGWISEWLPAGKLEYLRRMPSGKIACHILGSDKV